MYEQDISKRRIQNTANIGTLRQTQWILILPRSQPLSSPGSLYTQQNTEIALPFQLKLVQLEQYL